MAIFAMLRLFASRERSAAYAARILVVGAMFSMFFFVTQFWMAWMSRISIDAPYFPRIALPLVLLGIGMGIAFTPLTTAGIAGVEPGDAGAASGLVNAAHQLGGSLGLGLFVTVFASASHDPQPGVAAQAQGRFELAHAVASSVTGSAVFLALALAVAVVAVMPGRAEGAVAEPARG